jgi:arylsulfatase A-like enzyme
VDARLVQHVDLGPTFLELAGIEPPAGLDGSSFADRLFDGQLPGPDAVYVEMLFDGSPSKRSFEGVRTERYLYAEYGNGNKELYDLEEDPFQLQNRVNRPAYASIRQQLAARLEDFRE